MLAVLACAVVSREVEYRRLGTDVGEIVFRYLGIFLLVILRVVKE